MKWYELSEQDKARLTEMGDAYARSLADLELLKGVCEAHRNSLSQWLDAPDVGVCISMEAEAYRRNLLGPGRRVLPEFEAWQASWDGEAVVEVVYIIVDASEVDL